MFKITEEQRKDVEAREKIFNQSSPAQQRILIAEDVIARLQAEQLIADHTFGHFEDEGIVKHPFSLPEEKRTDFLNAQIRDVVGTEPKCSACGVGAIFISTFIYADKLQMQDLPYGLKGFHFTDIDRYLNKKLNLFSLPQLKLIEVAYEQGGGVFDFDDTEDFEEDYEDEFQDVRRAYYFGKEYEDDTERLIAIMENIIQNDGTFVP